MTASSTTQGLSLCKLSPLPSYLNLRSESDTKNEIAIVIVEHSSTECLGIHLGNPQSANLGDGNGSVNQTVELREDYGDATLGTCLESLIGGNHLRYVVPK